MCTHVFCVHMCACWLTCMRAFQCLYAVDVELLGDKDWINTVSCQPVHQCVRRLHQHVQTRLLVTNLTFVISSLNAQIHKSFFCHIVEALR